ncbi:MAG: type II toxin-antitoxin system VapC family toxin [Armatimonadetes bacterium]|nr:type II toxin-antitoxin system VapC family toxin [Armatimonadota bacterium]
MSRTVVLDAGPLGMLTNPAGSPLNADCRQWVEGVLLRGDGVAVPEIADYEVRRELLRASKVEGLTRLDSLRAHPVFLYLPLTTTAMDRAAEFWARARREHRPTASDSALDADVILAAQAAVLAERGHDVVIATTNPAHLAWLAPAALWTDL